MEMLCIYTRALHVQSHHSIAYKRYNNLLLLVRFFNLHARFKERNDHKRFAVCLAKKEVVGHRSYVYYHA